MKKNQINPAKVWLSSLNASSSISSYTFYLNNLCKIMSGNDLETYDWENLDYIKVLELRRILIDKDLKAGSINNYICAFKGVACEAWKLGILDIETYFRIKEIKRVKGNTTTVGRALSSDELHKIINYELTTSKKQVKRDSAILAISYGAGLRISEIAKLKMCDITNDSLIIHGKGSYDRSVYLPKFAMNSLNKWLDVRGRQDGPVFLCFLKGDIMKSRGVSRRTVSEIPLRRYKAAGIEKFTSHDLRRSFCTNLLDVGVDLSLVQQLMRHTKIETTRIYDKRGEKAKKLAVERLPF